MEPLLVDGILKIRRNTKLSLCCFLLAILIVGIGYLPFDWPSHFALPTIVSRTIGLALGLAGFALMKIDKYWISNTTAFNKAYSANYYLQTAIFGIMVICGAAIIKVPFLTENTQLFIEKSLPYVLGLLATLIIFANIRHRQIISLYGQKAD